MKSVYCTRELSDRSEGAARMFVSSLLIKYTICETTVPSGFISARERQGFLVGSCIEKNENMVIWKRYVQQRAYNSYLISILTSFTDHNPEQTAQECSLRDKPG